jgi:hypothetical protein
MNRAALLGVAVVAALGTSQALARPDYCSTYATQLTPGTLYVALPCESDPHQVCPVPAGTAPLKENVAYHFLYQTQATNILNSLVVIHVKGVAPQPVATPPVKLTRQRLSFACKSRTRIFSRPSYRHEVNNNPQAQEVPYDSYDLFNRYGYAPEPTRGTLFAFHTNYFNGSACVSTLEPTRRAEFLFAEQDNIPGFIVSTATQLGFRKPVATAGPINPYDHLRVIVANYKKAPQATGCISFVVRTRDKSLQIDLSDLEEKAQMPIYFTRRSWTLNTQ